MMNTDQQNNQAPASLQSGPRTLKLSRPLETNGGTVTVLTFREPIFDDYLNHGDLRIARGDATTKQMEFIVNRDALMGWTEALTGIDRMSLGALRMRDVNAITKIIDGLIDDDGGN